MLNIKLNRKNFLKKLQIVENAISDDRSESVNSGIVIEARNNKLVLKGIGVGLYIKAVMDCEIISEGEFIIRHKLMEEFLKQLNQDEIQIEEIGGKISIISGKSSSHFAIYEYTERNDQQINIGLECTFDREKLLVDLENSKFAAANTPEKAALNCLRVEIENNHISFVSSDSFRLVYINKPLENGKETENLGISIPLKSINSLIKIMKMSEDKNVKFKSDGTKVLFQFEDVEIITKLIEVQYQNYKSVLQSIKQNKRAIVVIADLINILKRTLVFVKDNTEKKDIAFFKFSSNNLEIVGKNDLATSKENLNSIYEGDDLTILLNARHLLEYLYTIDSKETLEINLFNDKSPVLLSVENNRESIYLMAPTRS